MKYPVANLGTGILGPAKPSLGRDTAEIQKARALLEKVRAEYPNLVTLLGQDKADKAVKQAQENLAKVETA